MTTPTCERCGQTLIVAGGMPEDSPHDAGTYYFVCPTHGTDYQRPVLTPERLAELRQWLDDSTGFEVDSIEAVEIVSECLGEIERLRALLPRWIPVTERLPTKDDADSQNTVLVRDASGRREDCYWHEVSVGVKMPSRRRITHWMPLPEHEGDKP